MGYRGRKKNIAEKGLKREKEEDQSGERLATKEKSHLKRFPLQRGEKMTMKHGRQRRTAKIEGAKKDSKVREQEDRVRKALKFIEAVRAVNVIIALLGHRTTKAEKMVAKYGRGRSGGRFGGGPEKRGESNRGMEEKPEFHG